MSPWDSGFEAGKRRRVLVVWEGGRGSHGVLRAAEELGRGGSRLTVVAVAPQAASRCCGAVGQAYFNCAVREEVQSDLAAAREQLGYAADDATLKVLVEGTDPPLAAWAGPQGFDDVILLRRRLWPGRHRQARALRRTTGAEVRLIDAARVPRQRGLSSSRSGRRAQTRGA